MSQVVDTHTGGKHTQVRDVSGECVIVRQEGEKEEESAEKKNGSVCVFSQSGEHK